MSKHEVVIIGGGFAGVKAALELVDDPKVKVTLVSERPDFRYYPTLYRTATGGRKMISSIPLVTIFAGKSITILQDSVTTINRQEKTIATKAGRAVKYDSLLLCLGVQTNYFNIPGLQKYSYGIKTIEDAEELKNHLHQQLIQQWRPDTNYIVIGAGPTGVELAGALQAYVVKLLRDHGISKRSVHIELVDTAPRILPRMPKAVSRRVARRLRKLDIRILTNRHVDTLDETTLTVDDRPIRSQTVIWTAGVTNNSFFKTNKFQLTAGGKVRVDQYLQAEPSVYVAGDNADTPYSGMAQTALYDGKFIASNITRLAHSQDARSYVAKRPIYVTPVGRHFAAVQWGGLRIYGVAGWGLRKLADYVAYHDYLPWRLAATLWLAENDEENTCSQCLERGESS
ncbi:MAG: FAD-dependent oxidoreductase [Candidatus Saccharimonadales bacterium]